MTLGCSKCDGYLQFYEELHFKYYNSTDLLLCWTDCCETVVVENLWKRPLGYSRAMIQKNENWWLNESNVCQRVRRFCCVLSYGGWSLMCFVVISLCVMRGRYPQLIIDYYYCPYFFNSNWWLGDGVWVTFLKIINLFKKLF